jgi:hypothetical protein
VFCSWLVLLVAVLHVVVVMQEGWHAAQGYARSSRRGARLGRLALRAGGWLGLGAHDFYAVLMASQVVAAVALVTRAGIGALLVAAPVDVAAAGGA